MLSHKMCLISLTKLRQTLLRSHDAANLRLAGHTLRVTPAGGQACTLSCVPRLHTAIVLRPNCGLASIDCFVSLRVFINQVHKY